ncbi:MAG TPA: hypothetical protein VKJ65_09945 [Phycisphaerae bacterium]|jgi:hypothetical protein|nr:hypothetical protein [Phycisphaerae bacterium]
MGIKVLCAAVAVWMLGGLSAYAGPLAADDRGERPQGADFQHSHRFLPKLHNPGKSLGVGSVHPDQPPAGELSEDERRTLRSDVERADREIYRK